MGRILVRQGMWDGADGLAVVAAAGPYGTVEVDIVDGPVALDDANRSGGTEVPHGGYVCDPPPCGECDHHGMCVDIARDGHETNDDISRALAEARETACVAVDLDRLLADAAAHSDDLEAWAATL